MTDEGRRLTARSSSSWPRAQAKEAHVCCVGRFDTQVATPRGTIAGGARDLRPAAGATAACRRSPIASPGSVATPQHVRHCGPRRTMVVSGPWGFSRPSESLNRLHLRLPPAPRPRHMAARHTPLFHRATAHRSSHPEFSFEKIASPQSCFSDLDSRHGSDPVCRQALV